ncbi:MAG: HD-GYP domain-containing protein [Burkholderiaceae bacterium]|jgi:putative nucleotidyltransferase with HDIG domain|nr:HD-GYP domain-containing protein [Burkholderiaceae bacterium]
MFVQELCGSWMEHPFWRAQFLLDDPADLARLRATTIREVWIDTARGRDVDEGSGAALSRAQADQHVEQTLQRAAAAPTAPPAADLQSEFEQARRLVGEARPAVISMFNHARLGRAVDLQGAAALVDRIRGAVRRSPTAVISVARLKRADEYTFMHSVAVSGLMIALAQQLQLGDEEISEAGLAGLLHDIGKARIDHAILNKPAALSDAEFGAMRQHPQLGHDILSQSGFAPGAVLDVVLHHHERIDGNGYPHALPAERIGRLARMAAICDVYDAITSVRAYKPGWDPAEAVRKMAEWTTSHFDAALFQAFVKTVGIYPVGSLVQMASGRLGVVMDQCERSLLTPKVKVFYSLRSQLRIAPEVIDLARPGTHDRIVGREDPARWRFADLDTLWQPQSRGGGSVSSAEMQTARAGRAVQSGAGR